MGVVVDSIDVLALLTQVVVHTITKAKITHVILNFYLIKNYKVNVYAEDWISIEITYQHLYLAPTITLLQLSHKTPQ